MENGFIFLFNRKNLKNYCGKKSSVKKQLYFWHVQCQFVKKKHRFPKYLVGLHFIQEPLNFFGQTPFLAKTVFPNKKDISQVVLVVVGRSGY